MATGVVTASTAAVEAAAAVASAVPAVVATAAGTIVMRMVGVGMVGRMAFGILAGVGVAGINGEKGVELAVLA